MSEREVKDEGSERRGIYSGERGEGMEVQLRHVGEDHV